jgi:hypothetical protein
MMLVLMPHTQLLLVVVRQAAQLIVQHLPVGVMGNMLVWVEW